jgi:hypothetical protein
MPAVKTCPRCGETRSVADFGRNRTLPGGLSFYYCKPCMRLTARAHYRKRREATGFTVREPDASPPGYKRCSACQESKPLTEFHKNRRSSSGHMSCCKTCRAVIDSDMRLPREYGITRMDLDALLEGQRGLCAICERRTAVHVDHDHATGRVRGVLCFACNVALGHLQDDVALFRKAIGYLERTINE